MKKNNALVSKTLSNVRKIKNYGKKTAETLVEMRKATGVYVYSLQSIRAVANENWWCEEIYDAMLVVLANDLKAKAQRMQVSAEVSHEFKKLSKTA